MGGYLSEDLIDKAIHNNNLNDNSLLLQIASTPKIDILNFEEDIFYRFMDCYINEILNVYDEKHIILLNIRNVFQFITSDYVQMAITNLNRWEKQNERIDKGYKYILKKLPNVHVIDFPITVVGNKNHKWGLEPLHYIDEYYDYAKRMETYEKYFLEVLLKGDCRDRIISFFKRNGFEKCAIYGVMEPIKFLLPVICDEIEIAYIVEDNCQEYEGIQCVGRQKYPYPETDVIIICDIVNGTAIKHKFERIQLTVPYYDMYEILDI